MIIRNGTIEFGHGDMHFVEKVGLSEAIEMVLDFKSQNKIPFVYDTYQLADLLMIRRKDLFSLSKNADYFYTYATIKKRDGSKRILCVPDAYLKSVQRTILSTILSKLSVSEYATAYRKGCKLQSNAQPHCGKKYLLKMDICNFFDNITFMKVYSSVFNTRHFPKQVGVMLTQLCCRNDVLPQGAPTSPAISNLVMKSFDDTFGAWCLRHNLSYTRYCDDITVSGDIPLHNVYLKASEMLHKMGFEVNKRKTHFVKYTDRQSVTGLTVNECIRVDSKYKKQLRQDIYYTLKFDVVSAMKRSLSFEFDENEDIDSAVIKYLNSLIGKTAYVLQIEPDNEYFKKSLKKLTDLLDETKLDIRRSKYFTFYQK